MWMQMFYEWAASRAKPKPTLEEELHAEAALLHRDTVYRELQLIDAQHKILANRAKAKFLLEQVTSDIEVIQMPPSTVELFK